MVIQCPNCGKKMNSGQRYCSERCKKGDKGPDPNNKGGIQPHGGSGPAQPVTIKL